jgi:NTP pyrophosphatase (non-canonical NTP hydrolase)
MNEKYTLYELQKKQLGFDCNHKSNINWHESINEMNIDYLEHLIVCTVGELGEFSNVVKKIKRGCFTYHDKAPELKDELADIFIYIVKLANFLDFELDEIYLSKLKKNIERFKKYEIEKQ